MARMEIKQGNTTETFVGSSGTLIELLRGRLNGEGLLIVAGEDHAEVGPLSTSAAGGGFTVTFDPARG